MYPINTIWLAALSMTSLSAAIPHSTCTSQPWEVRNLTVFEAASYSASGSFMFFWFSDPNLDVKDFFCGVTMDMGASSYENSLASYGWRKCESKELDIDFEITSYDLGLRRNGMECGRQVIQLLKRVTYKLVAYELAARTTWSHRG